LLTLDKLIETKQIPVALMVITSGRLSTGKENTKGAMITFLPLEVPRAVDWYSPK
jgi:hypothetical protein